MDIIKRLLTTLTNEELAEASQLVYEEILRRPGRESIAPSLTDEERHVARGHSPLMAIKMYRQRTGATLKAAKDVIDAARASEPKGG